MSVYKNKIIMRLSLFVIFVFAFASLFIQEQTCSSVSYNCLSPKSVFTQAPFVYEGGGIKINLADRKRGIHIGDFVSGMKVEFNTPTSQEFFDETVASIKEEQARNPKDVKSQVKVAVECIRKKLEHSFVLVHKKEYKDITKYPISFQYGASLGDIIDSGQGRCAAHQILLHLALKEAGITNFLFSSDLINTYDPKLGEYLFSKYPKGFSIYHNYVYIPKISQYVHVAGRRAFLSDFSEETLKKAAVSTGTQWLRASKEEFINSQQKMIRNADVDVKRKFIQKVAASYTDDPNLDEKIFGLLKTHMSDAYKRGLLEEAAKDIFDNIPSLRADLQTILFSLNHKSSIAVANKLFPLNSLHSSHNLIYQAA